MMVLGRIHSLIIKRPSMMKVSISDEYIMLLQIKSCLFFLHISVSFISIFPQTPLMTDSSDSSDENTSLYSEEEVYKVKNDHSLHKIISSMPIEDQRRYGAFRNTNFTRGSIKKYINQVIGQAVNPNIVIGVSGLCKVFVGELVSEAKEVQRQEIGQIDGNRNLERVNLGPLLPSHIDEAIRRLYKKMPNMKVNKTAPWRR